MASQREGGVFLEQRSYRRRRMIDGARLLPVIAAWLFMLPLLWPSAGVNTQEPRALSDALAYVFTVWLALTLVSGLFVFLIGDVEPEKDRKDGS
ncbi:MAG: hypothetical protein AAF754_01550 [Pseudomonadota bacterium]